MDFSPADLADLRRGLSPMSFRHASRNGCAEALASSREASDSRESRQDFLISSTATHSARICGICGTLFSRRSRRFTQRFVANVFFRPASRNACAETFASSREAPQPILRESARSAGHFSQDRFILQFLVYLLIILVWIDRLFTWI